MDFISAAASSSGPLLPPLLAAVQQPSRESQGRSQEQRPMGLEPAAPQSQPELCRHSLPAPSCTSPHQEQRAALERRTQRPRPQSQRPRPQSQRPSLQSQRPSLQSQRHAPRTGGPRGVFFDSAAELLTALSQEERELLETITERGYPLRTAILALQKTGYHSPEKILKYLMATDRLCKLGYDEAQVEEALEMFQNCESKAAEFLRLLTQFNEMGFQQSAIKEVLLVHENHRERALEELMTRMA
uniref:UBA domain-containing protein n=1 Tax=Dicentrarchus labrax TaxID=13489 RepID=A0A8P4GLC6_DICLA